MSSEVIFPKITSELIYLRQPSICCYPPPTYTIA